MRAASTLSEARRKGPSDRPSHIEGLGPSDPADVATESFMSGIDECWSGVGTLPLSTRRRQLTPRLCRVNRLRNSLSVCSVNLLPGRVGNKVQATQRLR